MTVHVSMVYGQIHSWIRPSTLNLQSGLIVYSDTRIGPGSQIRLQFSAAGPTKRPQPKVIKAIIMIKLKLWPAAGCEANAAAEFGSRP